MAAPLYPALEQMSRVPKMLNFGSSKPGNPETENSFLSLLSSPPSLLQFDFHHHPNFKSSSSSSYPNQTTLKNANAMGNWLLQHDNGNLNLRDGAEVHPVCPPRPPMSTTNGYNRAICDNLDSLRSFSNRTGFKSQSDHCTSLQRGLTCSPSGHPNGEIFHALNGYTMFKASLQTSSSTSTKEPSVKKLCPRVFCMGACGDLLISNTGLFGILCSCHGARMSVSNFCEHSGLFEFNPGYAVRMETGECIAQWRKVYLQKFGITAPEDHRGWNWPEGLLPTSPLPNASRAVVDRKKVFDLSGLFSSSANAAKSTLSRKHVSNSRALSKVPKVECANQVSTNGHQNYGCDQCNFQTGLMGMSGRYLHTMPEYPGIPCSSASCLTAPDANWRQSLHDGSQSRSFNFNVSPASEILPGSAIQTLQSTVSETHRDFKDNADLLRGNPIGLKLGQPSQLGWNSGSSPASVVKPHFMDVRSTAVQEKLTSNLANSKVIENSNQHNDLRAAFKLCKTKQKSHLGRTDGSTYVSERDGSHVVNLKDGSANFSTVAAVVPSSNTLGEESLHKKINKGVIETYPLSPLALQYLPNAGRSSLIDLACNENRPIRPLDANIIALQKNKNITVCAKDGNSDPTFGSGQSFTLYAKQMDSSGLLTRYGNHPNFCGIPNEEISSVRMPSLLQGISGASSYAEDAFSLRSYSNLDRFTNEPKSSSIDFGTNPTSQTASTGFTSLAAVLPSGHGSSFNKVVDGVSLHMSNDRLEYLTLRNLKQSVSEKPEDAPIVLKQQMLTNSEGRQQSKTYISSDMEVYSSLLSKEPVEGQKNGRQMDEHRFDIGHSTSPIFLPGVCHDKGTNRLEEFGAYTQGITDINQGPCDPQPEQRCENKASNSNMSPRCYRGPHAYSKTDMPVQMTYFNQESDSKDGGSVNGVQKQFTSATVTAHKLSGAISPVEISLGKDNLVVCNEKGKKQMLYKLNCLSSQWRDVPSKTVTGFKRRRLDAPTQSLQKREDSETHLNEHSAKGITRSNQVANFSKGKEISNDSSECSAPAVTQASNEVNKSDCCTVDGGDTRYIIDQIVDQGSAIVRSCSSVNAIDSARSAQPDSCGKLKSTETISTIIAHYGQDDELKQMQSNSNELQVLDIADVSSDEIFCEVQEHVDGCRSTKSKDHASDDFEHRTCVSECVQVVDCDSNGHCLERKSTLCQVKKFSRHRDRYGPCYIEDGEHDDQRLPKGSDESVDGPANTAAKRIRWTKFDNAEKKQIKSTKDLKGFLSRNPNSNETSRCSLKSRTKAKPIACGKYGIICDQKLDIDRLKPPKIVPLSQVLSVSRRCTISEKESSSLLARKMNNELFSEHRRLSNVPSKSRKSQDSGVDKVPLCNDQNYDASTHETRQIQSQNDEHSADDITASEESGADGCKEKSLVSLCPHSTQSKTKEIRMGSLYELSMRGNKFISADLSLSQNIMCAPSIESQSDRNASEYAGESGGSECRAVDSRRSVKRRHCKTLISDGDALCCVCGISNKDDSNILLECESCLIRIHQACYGISRVPKGEWFCRPCRTNSKDVVCVLCGYGGGAMTRAFGSRNVVKSLLKAWNIRTESHIIIIGSSEPFHAKRHCGNKLEISTTQSCPLTKPVVHNSIIAGLFNSTVKQWVHMVCGLWTPGTRCPNVGTMSAFDVSGICYPKAYVVCSICKRSGGSCIRCRIETCCAQFHPWCAHQKGLLQSEVEGVDGDKVGFYGRCLVHASYESCMREDDDDVNEMIDDVGQDQEPTCARTEAYQGKTEEGQWPRSSHQHNGNGGGLVTQVQLDAWLYINRHKLGMRRESNDPISDVEHDYRKEYALFKLAKGWKRLVVYKSGIHALGLYTSQFIPRGAMVVEYIGEIVGLRVADKRETEYLAGRKLHYKSACYFFRIDKEQIIDATRKGGIARFVNHSCQPNCIAKVITIRSQKKVVFFAQNDICPGEEITYDYHFNHEDEGKKIPCLCNAKNCRRYLN